jgi:hypothetical protein
MSDFGRARGPWHETGQRGRLRLDRHLASNEALMVNAGIGSVGIAIGDAAMVRTAFENQTETQEAREHSEGPVARTIEQETAKIPSDAYLWAALGSMGVSLVLQLSGKKEESLFVGQWAPSFLLLGVYNKLVKIAGSDRVHA